MSIARRRASRASPIARWSLVLVAFQALCWSAASAQTPQYEEGIVEVVAERLSPLALVVLVDSGGGVLLPLANIADYLELATSWDGTTLQVPSVGGGSARLDTVAGTLTAASTTSQLAPAEIARRGSILYLRAERVAQLLGAEVQVDFSTLTVAIARETPFPAQQRIIAEQRRAVLTARQQQLDRTTALDSAPYLPVTGGGIADWQISTRGLDPTSLTTLRMHVGAALLGGDLGTGAVFEAGSDATDHVHDVTLRYHRVFPRAAWIRQVSAGDILTSGVFARFVRGVELSNRPFMRSPELSSILVHPDLPPGWEYEIFQGSELLGYSDIASHDPVAVPLRAGATPVQVRMYGPSGEEVVSTLLYQTPVSLLRRDEVEYSIGGGECAASCDQFAHADVRYGLGALVTVGGGAEVFRDSAGSRARPYFVSSLATGLRATAELTFMPFDLYSANVALFPREGSRANLRGSLSRPGLGPISLATHDRKRWDLEVLWDERIEAAASRFSQLRFGASAAGQLGQVDRWRVTSMASFRRGFVELRYDHDNATTQAHLLSARSGVYVPITVRGNRFRPLFTTALGASGDGLALAEAGVSVQPRANSVITAAAQWGRGSSRPALSIGFNARTGHVQTAARAVSSPSGVASSSLMVSGSTAFTHDGSVTVHPSARTGYAGLHGVVFIDRNNDGSFSPGEETVPGADLIVGGIRATSTDDGTYHIWGMRPYQAVAVAVDSARTPDPSLTTSRSGMVVRPAPNFARRVDIPLVRTSELVGTITAAPQVATVAGISLDITDLDSGAVTTAVTFSDGFYYVSRLRPGRYRIAVSPASLDALGARASPAFIDFTVDPAADELVVELPPIHLH
ncbi:MAG TPA: carboxypeptidase-like regulatory domain-containing protein [Longimicrobiales bacterium]|nr:carboxypeptidase-like regulatory domain-containing protein [Longimicrobiales bacterium]